MSPSGFAFSSTANYLKNSNSKEGFLHFAIILEDRDHLSFWHNYPQNGETGKDKGWGLKKELPEDKCSQNLDLREAGPVNAQESSPSTKNSDSTQRVKGCQQTLP